MQPSTHSHKIKANNSFKEENGEVRNHRSLFKSLLRGAMEKQAHEYRTKQTLSLIQLLLSQRSPKGDEDQLQGALVPTTQERTHSTLLLCFIRSCIQRKPCPQGKQLQMSLAKQIELLQQSGMYFMFCKQGRIVLRILLLLIWSFSFDRK